MTWYPIIGPTFRLEPLTDDLRPTVEGLLRAFDARQDWSLYGPDGDPTRSRTAWETMTLTVRSGTSEWFAAVGDGEEQPTGLVALTDLDWVERTATLMAVFSDADRQAKRFSEPLKLALGYSFRQLGLRRVSTRSVVTDTAGATQLTAFGFVKEGVLRQAVRHNGDLLDVGLWGCLKTEFRG